MSVAFAATGPIAINATTAWRILLFIAPLLNPVVPFITIRLDNTRNNRAIIESDGKSTTYKRTDFSVVKNPDTF